MIVIAGDSWLCGEWTQIAYGNKGITDPGITALFAQDGYQAVNISQPGASLEQISQRVRDHLRQNRHLTTDMVLVAQTEFVRSAWFLDPNWDQAYRSSRDTVLHQWYHTLDQLAQDYQTKIFLVGGLGEVISPAVLEEKYPALRCVCQSWTNLVINDRASVTEPCLAAWDPSTELIVTMMKSRSVIDEIQELLDALDLAQARTDAWRANPQWFFPDGMHPNRHAHHKLYEYIKPQLGL